jgi:hypothetical protein
MLAPAIGFVSCVILFARDLTQTATLIFHNEGGSTQDSSGVLF